MRTLAPSLALIALLIAPAASLANSDLRLEAPGVIGTIPASTHDDDGEIVGEANLIVEELDGGEVRMMIQSGIKGGARTVMSATLGPTGEGTALAPLRQESRSFDPSGAPLGILSIDHRKNEASCAMPNGDGLSTHTRELPERDLVANVTLNLLFRPLVDGTTKSVPFTLFMCGGGPRFVDFEARVERRAPSGNGKPGEIVEVVYRPNLGAVVSMLARAVIPRLSVWFDPAAREPWIGHRVPLYSTGPEVVVIREGVAPALLLGH